MSLKKKTLNGILAGALLVGLAGTGHEPALADGGDKEKCYGVVKAGHNDCGNKAGTHSCMGQSRIDGDGTEFVAVPKGLCEKLVGGSVTPYEGTNPRTGHGKRG